MESCSTTQNKNCIVASYVLIGIALVCTLIPIIVIGFHARPHLDDLAYTARSSFRPINTTDIDSYVVRSVRYAVLHGGLADIARATWYTVSDNYFEWQGTFSAIVIFALHPGVLINEEAYPLVMVFTLGALLFSTAVLCRSIWYKPRQMWIPFFAISFLSIQWLPNMANGFFWWNGATYYTLFYSFMLISISCKIRLMRDISGWYLLLAVVLNFIIGGGNFLTALLNLEIAFLFLVFAILKKKKIVAFSITFFAAVAAFMISILAPGNAIRQASGVEPNAFRAIIRSVLQAGYDTFHWTSPIVLVAIILFLPLIWQWTSDLEYTFRYPALVCVFSFLLLASMNAPAIYALGFEGGGKIRNVVFFAFQWFLLGNIFYIVGWIQRRFAEKLPCGLAESFSYWPRHYPLVYSLLLFGFVAITPFYKWPDSSFALSVRELRSGVVHDFLDEYEKRIEIMRNPSQTSPAIEPFSNHPYSLVPWDEGGAELDVDAYAQYYSKEHIYALPQYRPLAQPGCFLTRLGKDGSVLAQISTYSINDVSFVRLRDLAYLLVDTFEVVRVDNLETIVTDQLYTPFGNELRDTNRWIVAQLIKDAVVIVDGQPMPVISYDIDGEIFYKLDDLSLIFNLSVSWHDGGLWLMDE